VKRIDFSAPLPENKRFLLWGAAFIALFAVLWIIYSPSMKAPFYFDSIIHLVVYTDTHMTKIDAESLWRATHSSTGGAGLYRPVSYLTLAFTYYFTRLDPYYYRVGNLVIHALSMLSVLFLFHSLFRVEKVRRLHPFVRQYAFPLAFLTAALWALHPIQTNVVIYVIQRMASLAGLFTFLCVGCYLRLRSTHGRAALVWALACLAAFGLALGSKENSVTLLPLLAAAEFMFFADFASPRYRRIAFWIVFSSFAVFALYCIFRFPMIMKMQGELWGIREFTVSERLLTQVRLQFWYLFLLLVPDPRALSFDAEVQISHGLFSPPETFFTLLGILGAFILAGVWAKKRPLLSFGILWFFLAQVVEATILPLEMFFEHRMYIPSVVVFLGIATVLVGLYHRIEKRKAFFAALVVLGLGFVAAGTMSRSILWSDQIEFLRDSIAKSPGKSRPYVALSSVYMAQGRLDEAEELLNKALEIGGEATPLVQTNLALIAARRGQNERAEALFQQAAQADNDAYASQALHFAAEFKYRLGQYDDARNYAEACLRMKKDRSSTWNLLGLIQLGLKDTAKAEIAFQKAARLDPSFADPVLCLANIYVEKKDYAHAAKAYNEVAARNTSQAAYFLKRRDAVLKLASEAKEAAPPKEESKPAK
jgi:tetratricopeptide (TPR) repeat protein